jgi:DNA-binding GntR family transcriptional regulator
MSTNVGDQLVSAQQATHAKLRAMIFSGELQAGQPLRQEEIARRLGVSRLPVREALSRLATEGLVELKPRRGFFVTTLKIDEIEDIFDMRAMLEERAGYLATTQRTLADADALDDINRSLEAAVDHPSLFEHWTDLNLKFHARLYQASGRKHLCRQIELLRDTVAPLIRILALQTGELRRSQSEHRNMVALFRAGDAAGVAQACREHCAYTARMLVNQLRTMPAARTSKTFDNAPEAA